MSKKLYVVPVKFVTNIREPFIDITNYKDFPVQRVHTAQCDFLIALCD